MLPLQQRQADASSTIKAYKNAHPTQLVVAYLHVGPNFAWAPAPMHEQLLRNISVAGADLVWGTSSHHIQKFEVWEGKKSEGETLPVYRVSVCTNFKM